MLDKKEWTPRFGEWIEDTRKFVDDPSRRVRFVAQQSRGLAFLVVVAGSGRAISVPSDVCTPCPPRPKVTADLRRRLRVLEREARRAKLSPVYYSEADCAALADILDALEMMELVKGGEA